MNAPNQREYTPQYGVPPKSELDEMPLLPPEAYKKAAAFLDNPLNNVDMRAFTSLFHVDAIAADERRVMHKKSEIRTQESFEQRAIARYAGVLEAFFILQAGRWFGKKMRLGKASEYDDLFNGDDCNVELLSDTGIVHMALDVTSSEKSIMDKLNGIKYSIDTGKLTEIRYFQSPSDEEDCRSLVYVPKCLVAIDRKMMPALAAAWIQPGNVLVNHPLQCQILEQLELQLMAFVEYAASRSCSRNVLAPLKQVLGCVRAMKLDKQKSPLTNHFNSIQNDPMLKLLKTNLANLFTVQTYQQAA